MESHKKQQNDNKTNLIQWMVPCCLLFVYLVVVLLNYSTDMKEKSKQSIHNDFLISAEELSNSIIQEVNTTAQVADTTAALISKQIGVLSEKSIDMLNAALTTCNASSAYVISSDGEAKNNAGEAINITKNLGSLNFTSDTSTISDIIYNEETGTYDIQIVAPITEGKTVRGYVCFVYPTERFCKMPHLSENNGRTIYALLKQDGTIVSIANQSKLEMGDNLLANIVYEDADNTKTKTKIMQNMQNGKSGIQDCQVKGEGKTVVYKSTGINGWYVIEMHDPKFVEQLLQREYSTTSSVISRIILSIALFFGILVFINILNKTIYSKQSKELKNRAETDLLTGLLNKIATEKHIQEYLEDEGKDKQGLLFVLDIDNFKKINDTMGHAFGDEVLSTLGVNLKSEFRITDIVGRIGGDEFLVYLKDVKDDISINRETNRILNFFNQFKAGGYVKYSATASIGVAIYPQDGATFEELYKAADKGVYKAKHRGKNQLAFCKEEESED
ncbi:MAG: diguanylate cyclase [Lachnospiraceae bacterium]|nr:diguanylate cyclase [Lachnospiraceae bacterium]